MGKTKFTEDKCEVLLCGRQIRRADANWDAAGSGGPVQRKLKVRGGCGMFCGCLHEGRTRADVADRCLQSYSVERGRKDAHPGWAAPALLPVPPSALL